MPLIDVSDVLLDPDFIEAGLVCARTPRTMDKGRAVDGVPVNATFAGVVVPDTGKVFERTPETTEILDAHLIFTQFRLQPADVEANIDADVVTTTRGTYRVRKVMDWSQYGAGFVVALCERVAR